MAKFDAKSFNPQAFGKYVERIPKTRKNELIKSGVLKGNQEIRNAFSSQTGTAYAVLPMYGRIGGAVQNYDGETDMTAQSSTTYERGVVVVGRMGAWVEKDFSTDITGGVDFMDNVAAQVSEYFEDVDQDTLLAILKGIFAMTGAKNLEFVNNHTLDITGEAEEKAYAGPTTLNTAIQKASGDKKAKFTMAIMHSNVATNLENLQLLAYLKYTDANGVQRDLTMASWNGRIVLIDDNMPTEDVEAVEESGTKFDVTTLLGAKEIDKQTVTNAEALIDNDFVVFKKDATLTVTAGTALTSGTNGTATGKEHQDFLNKLEAYSFNTLGCLNKTSEVTALYVAYTKRLRDEQGVKFQTVLYNTNANYEGIINLKNKVNEDETGLIYWLTGASAGCAINSSNTNKVYDGEYTVDTDYTQSELKECIKGGELVLHKVGDEVRVLTDINSLVDTTQEKGEDFKSNQTIRVLDQVATDIASTFNNKYLGKIQNNASGRVSLWNDIVTLFKEYATLQAIENFKSEEITIEVGNDKKSVVVNSKVQPVNAMEKLYMSVVVA